MIADSLRSLVGLMESKAPQLTILVQKGQFTLTKSYERVFWFQMFRAMPIFRPINSRWT